MGKLVTAAITIINDKNADAVLITITLIMFARRTAQNKVMHHTSNLELYIRKPET